MKLVGGALSVAAIAAFAAGCAMQQSSTGWTTLINGTQGLDNFTRAGGEANWAAKDGAIEATAGGKDSSFLMTKSSYKDFVIRVEFWASDDANSGIYIRCQDRSNVTDENCYEANIFDQRPDQTYATGAIVKVAPVMGAQPKVGGKWSVMEVTANGPQLTVVLNGTKTVDVRDAKFASGPIGLQWARGTIKFRKVEIRTL